MKTTTVEVGGLVSSPSAAGVQRRRAAHAGVRQIDVERVAGGASIHDELRDRRRWRSRGRKESCVA